MLSSVAERVYWLGRYLERIENSARLMDVYSSMLFDLPGASDLGWSVLLDITGTREAYEAKHTAISEMQVMKFLIADLDNTSSVYSCMKLLRENARTTREVIPSEAWEQINDLHMETKSAIQASMGRQARRELFDGIVTDCQRLGGLLSGCMSHNTAYTFIQLGRCIERADMSTRIVDVGSISLLPAFKQFRPVGGPSEPFENVVWMNILRCLSGYQAYRQHIHNRVKGEEVVRFLLQDEEFPRAVNYCLAAMNRYLEHLPNHDEVQRAVLRVRRVTSEARVETLLEKGLLDFIDELQISIADIHDELSKTWFGGGVEAEHEEAVSEQNSTQTSQVSSLASALAASSPDTASPVIVKKKKPAKKAKTKAKPKAKSKAGAKKKKVAVRKKTTVKKKAVKKKSVKNSTARTRAKAKVMARALASSGARKKKKRGR